MTRNSNIKVIDLTEDFPSISQRELDILERFIKQILWLKEDVINEFDNRKSRCDISCVERGFDISFNEDEVKLVRELLMTDERIREVSFDFELEEIKLYPARPEHAYDSVNVAEKKLYGETALNRYFNDIDDAVSCYSSESKAKNGVVIEKVIELKKRDYGFFIRNIQQDAGFINDNSDVQFVDSQMNIHCLFVKQKASEQGLLICKDSETNDFYSGFVPNLDDFQEISMEEYNEIDEQSGPEMV